MEFLELTRPQACGRWFITAFVEEKEMLKLVRYGQKLDEALKVDSSDLYRVESTM